MPLGATMCTAKIYEAYRTSDRTKTFFHGHSYTANPLACASAIASLEWFGKGDVMNMIGQISATIDEARTNFSAHSAVADARCMGTILAIEIKTPEQNGYLNAVGEIVAQFFQERGIIIRPLGNVVYCIPPYCITDGELKIIFTAIEEFLSAYSIRE